jgi:hypothetical protein
LPNFTRFGKNLTAARELSLQKNCDHYAILVQACAGLRRKINRWGCAGRHLPLIFSGIPSAAREQAIFSISLWEHENCSEVFLVADNVVRCEMRNEDETSTGSQFELSGNQFLGWKTKTAARVRAWLLVLMGLCVFLLPVIGSAQPVSVEGWQKVIKDAPQSKPGCFKASYPNMDWQEVPCALRQQQPLGIVLPLSQADSIQTGRVIGGGYSAAVANNAPPIRSAEGSFLNVQGVTEIKDIFYNSGSYSLQINSNFFDLGSIVQFVYSNDGYEYGTIKIEYWARSRPT